MTSSLCAALMAAVRPQGRPTRQGRARSLEEVIEAVGGTYALVSWMAGTGVRSSRAYRSAARRVQRWLKGTRHPQGAALRRLRHEATRREHQRRVEDRRTELRQSGTPIDIIATITVSKDTRHRRVRGPFNVECWEDIIEALDAGDCETAEEAFEECFGESAGFGATPEFEDVELLEVG